MPAASRDDKAARLVGCVGSWLLKIFCICLLLALGLVPQAWAQAASPGGGKTTPIIDIVAVVPGSDHAAKLNAKPDAKPVDIKAARLLSSSGSLDVDRRLAAESSNAGQGQFPNLIVGNGMGLDGRWESWGNWNGSSGAMRPLDGAEARLDDQDPQGGFLALKLPAGALGNVMVGGGYLRSYSATSGETASSSAPRGALAAVRGTSETTSYDSMGRLNAFVAMPYQITQRVGVRPELSYYHGDNPSLGPEAGNEWVMGLRFTFGF